MLSNEHLYDHIGAGYNSTRQADPYLAERLYRLLSPEKDGCYFDIGCGTGNYTIALANKGLNFCGVEPSERMLGLARSRSSKVNWINGTAENIPADDDSFDGGIATLTIHHWTNLHTAFAEIYRVLRQNAPLVIFTATPEQMRGYWLNHYFPRMLADSILQMPAFEKIEEAATAAGFVITGTEPYFIKDGLQDHFLYVGKNRPELYLDAAVRSGISSFSALANAAEVKQGLDKLAMDIELNSFEPVKSEYANDLGDYLFISLKKC